MSHVGMGRGTITRQGQLHLSAPHETANIVASNTPVVWAVTDDDQKAVLSRVSDPIATRTDLSPCGTSVPEADQTIAVPLPVFESVEGIEPGTEVVLVLNREMAEQGLTYVVAMDRVHGMFPEISWGQPGKRF